MVSAFENTLLCMFWWLGTGNKLRACVKCRSGVALLSTTLINDAIYCTLLIFFNSITLPCRVLELFSFPWWRNWHFKVEWIYIKLKRLWYIILDILLLYNFNKSDFLIFFCLNYRERDKVNIYIFAWYEHIIRIYIFLCCLCGL